MGKTLPKGEPIFNTKDGNGQTIAIYKGKDGQWYRTSDYNKTDAKPISIIQSQPAMLGVNGTRIISTTVWKEQGSRARIDVENPNPGVRPGQIHYQDAQDKKYYYNPDNDKFYVGEISKGVIAPNNIQELLKNPKFRAGINKGLTYLEVKK